MIDLSSVLGIILNNINLIDSGTNTEYSTYCTCFETIMQVSTHAVAIYIVVGCQCVQYKVTHKKLPLKNFHHFFFTVIAASVYKIWFIDDLCSWMYLNKNIHTFNSAKYNSFFKILYLIFFLYQITFIDLRKYVLVNFVQKTLTLFSLIDWFIINNQYL